MKEFDVFGLGNPLIDVLLPVEDQFLDDLGVDKNTMCLVDQDRQQVILEKAKDLPKKVALGGSCGNTVVSMAQLGSKTAFCGKAGNDQFGKDYQDQLVASGVTNAVQEADGVTGSTVILISPDAARTMNTHLGMCLNLSEDDIDLSLIEKSTWIYVEGYLWDTPSQKKAIMKALKHAKKVGTKISFSLSDPFCVQRNKDEFIDLLKNYIDLVFCNEEEALSLTSAESYDVAAKIIEGYRTKHIVITLGKEGAYIQNKEEKCKVTAFPVNAVDTTGAGDSFAAGYLHGITHDYTTQHAGMIASLCAAKIVSQVGPRFDGDLQKELWSFQLDLIQKAQNN
ncbi:MAG: sugar/nucleoside kinase (ribokinase family) [bacterium]|jgi:sugar/nucleoside kinase (ribokinase family)